MRGLHKTYSSGRHETVALDGVDLFASAGDFVTVLGPSGSGKTTLLRCIAGFETPDAGTITLAGRELDSPASSSVPAHDRGIGVVPQEGALFPHLSVARNIAFGIVDQPRDQRKARVAELLELIGLERLGDRRPHQLSGGQQQRVALARALAPAPRLILLDEPFSALDAQLRVELREEVRDVLRQVNTTALLVTHDQAEAMAMADHLVVMRAGRVVAAGEPRAVYDAPADAEVGTFLGDAVVLPGVRESVAGECLVRCSLGLLAVVDSPGDASVDATGTASGEPPALGLCEVLVRPEHLTLDRLAGGARTGVPGVVVSQSFYGHDSLVRVRLESGERVSARVHGEIRFAPDDVVSVRVDAPVTTFPVGRSAH